MGVVLFCCVVGCERGEGEERKRRESGEEETGEERREKERRIEYREDRRAQTVCVCDIDFYWVRYTLHSNHFCRHSNVDSNTKVGETEA